MNICEPTFWKLLQSIAVLSSVLLSVHCRLVVLRCADQKMDNQGTQTKGQNFRMQIKGDLSAEYFEQSMAVTIMDGIMYLRIGNDIYEGLPVDRSTDGTALHFDLTVYTDPSGTSQTTFPGELTNYAVSDREYRFFPVGTMSSPVPPETEKNERDVEFPDLNFTDAEKSAFEIATLIGQKFTDADRTKDFLCISSSLP